MQQIAMVGQDGRNVQIIARKKGLNFKAADLQNILENQIFQNTSSNTYHSC